MLQIRISDQTKCNALLPVKHETYGFACPFHSACARYLKPINPREQTWLNPTPFAGESCLVFIPSVESLAKLAAAKAAESAT
jgi:hypothetical protein